MNREKKSADYSILCILCDKYRLCNGTDLCGWWRTEFLVSLWDPSSRALSTAVSRRSSMLLSVFSLSWSTTAYTQTHAKARIKKLVFCFWVNTPENILGTSRALTAFDFGLQHKPWAVVTPASLSCCGDGPWDVDISVQRQRNVPHVHPDIHLSLSLCKINPRSVCICTPQREKLYFSSWSESSSSIWLSVDPRIYYSVFHTLVWRGALSEI